MLCKRKNSRTVPSQWIASLSSFASWFTSSSICLVIFDIITTLSIHYSQTSSLQAQNLPLTFSTNPTHHNRLLVHPDHLHDNHAELDLSCSLVYFHFMFAAQCYASTALAVVLSVSPSITFIDSVETNKHIFTICSPSGSHCTKRHGNIPTGRRVQVGLAKISILNECLALRSLTAATWLVYCT